MPFYRDRIYPHLVRKLGDPPPIREIRGRVVPLAEGKVLEIGVGPGVNFVHYDPARVTKVYALEPNAGDDPASRTATAPDEAGHRVSGSAGRTHSLGERQRRYRCEHLYVVHGSGRGGGPAGCGT